MDDAVGCTRIAGHIHGAAVYREAPVIGAPIPVHIEPDGSARPLKGRFLTTLFDEVQELRQIGRSVALGGAAT
jgi:hypothetical protein